MTDGAPFPPSDGTATLAELSADAPRAGAGTLDTLLDMTLPVSVEFGRASLSIQQVLDLGPGSVIQLERLVGEPIDIFVGDRRLAEGEVVVIGDTFGVRITRVSPPPREAARPGPR
ncbi:MAG TPA: FliM/FliN family flagellar motor switch protein [Gemmatimonadales bacterium]|jgi:flagellar motor switch protein FliN/FliY